MKPVRPVKQADGERVTRGDQRDQRDQREGGTRGDQGAGEERGYGRARSGRRLRRAVHELAAHRLGAAEPRQQSPADLRLVPPAVAAWAGAALAPALPADALATAVGGCLLAAVVFCAAAWARGRVRTASGSPSLPAGGVLVAAAVVALCAAAGGTVAGLHATAVEQGPLPTLAERYAVVTASVTLTADPRLAKPRPGGGPSPVVVAAEATRVRTTDGRTTVVRNPVLVIAPPQQAESWLGLLPTTRLEVTARLAPALENRGEPVAAVLRVTSDSGPQMARPPTVPQRLAGKLRDGLLAATDGLPTDARAMLPALVVGDASRVPPDLWEAVQATDMTHLIVVSGAHVSLVLAVLIGAPRTASRAERRGLAAWFGVPLRLTAVLGAGLLLAFVVVCRPGPSVLRAAVCGGVTLLAIATGRRRSLLPALAAAVLLLVLYQPELARSYGFLLSVLATGALLVVAPRWSLALQARGVPLRLAEALAVTAAAQAVCAPVVAVFAARVSLVAVPCNLLAEVAFAPATLLGCAAMVVAPISLPVASALAWLGSWPARWIAEVARAGADLPGAQAAWSDGWAGALSLAVVTGGVLLVLRFALRHVWLAAGCAILLLVAVLRPEPLDRFLTGWPPSGWRMVACDVGQGDALVFNAGQGSALVVDVGPDPAVIDTCLRRLGVRRVPLLVLSHPHADHVAGLPGVFKGRSVGAVQTSPGQEPAGQAEFVAQAAEEAGVPTLRARVGERRSLAGGALAWQVLWPPEHATHLNANDSSVTLLLRSGGLTFFLPGDLEPPAQRSLLARYPGLADVDVLKVAHHGSAYQHPELLRRLKPEVAVVSTGEDNGYGHPAPATLMALRSLGAWVLRTDTEGDVAVVERQGRAQAVHAPRRARARTRSGRRVRPARRRRGEGAVRRARSPPARRAACVGGTAGKSNQSPRVGPSRASPRRRRPRPA